MKKKGHWIFWAFFGIILAAGMQLAAEESFYGHISFVDNGAEVMRADGGTDQAVVNMPLAPGDTVATAVAGRCEFQFDNGTVVRLDKDSRLRLATVLAPGLTSNYKITTLELEKGQMYALPQAYGREMFQVVTANATVNLKRRARATIRLDAGGGTSFFSDGGKFQLLYGAEGRSLKMVTVRTDRPVAITPAHVPAGQVKKRDIEFMAWNEFLDRHFKELHYGISKVPPKLRFGNTALVHWAEKWSSLVGEWIYDELFGYVWRPADEQFAFSQRPFFHADFVRINGQLFLVPQEPWGWVPAHMGTWVWLKRGWTWVPGNWFHNGIVDYQGIHTFPTFHYYWNMYAGYRDPRLAGEPGWPDRLPKEARPPRLPGPVIKIVKKIVKAPDAEKRRIVDRVVPAIDGGVLPPALVSRAELQPASPPAAGSKSPARVPGLAVIARDWNPDARWAEKRGIRIEYSSSKNLVVCPALNVSSDRVTGVKRVILRGEAGNQGPAGVVGGTTAPPPADPTAISTVDGSAAGVKATATDKRVGADEDK